MKKILKWLLLSLVLVFCLLAIIAYNFREPLLVRAGYFMAPTGDYKADVVILEGSDYINSGFIKKGRDLLAEGKVKKIIVVIHRIAPAHRPFGINGDYPDAVREKLLNSGLREEQFKIIVAPIRHPVTLKEAATVLQELNAENVASAILVAPSFHTRRSYLAYQYIGEPLQIKIYPQACFTDYHQEKWWEKQTQWRDFGTETFKLFYYLAAGHIPFKLSY